MKSYRKLIPLDASSWSDKIATAGLVLHDVDAERSVFRDSSRVNTECHGFARRA